MATKFNSHLEDLERVASEPRADGIRILRQNLGRSGDL